MRLNRLFAAKHWYIVGAAALIAMLLSMGMLTSTAQAQSLHQDRSFYQQTNLVSDTPGLAPVTDPNLINPWGLVAGPTTPFWVSDNNSGFSTLYTAQGQIVPLVVTIPVAPGSPAGTLGSPDGIVFNGKSEFNVTENGKSGPALFIFSTEDGTISGWNPNVDLTNAILTVNNSPAAVYKGLALASTHFGDFLYAANFRAGTIDVFNTNFAPVHFFGHFRDPFMQRGFAPFNITSSNHLLYVTYAKQDAAKHDDVAGPGNGFIDVFDDFGDFLFRLVSRGHLNSPWGMAIAPNNFGQFSGDLLVGNFGDGHINVYDPFTGRFMGMLRDQHHRPIVNEGLWSLTFGSGAQANGPTNTLFFTAGIGNGNHGLFGQIVSVSA